MELAKIIELVNQKPIYNYVKKTLRAISHSFQLFDLKSLFISFNGGKDAEVVLHLVRLALYQYGTPQQSEEEKLKAFQNHWKEIKIVYFEETNPLKEVDDFTKEHAHQFNFDLMVFGKDAKKETFTLVENHGMKAIFLGTRRCDPYSSDIEVYSPSDTDKGWAPFMRIHPIIDWNYEQIWRFLVDFKFPYCSLYDEGYTHLGNSSNSGPNCYLKLNEGEYLPAYKADGKYEHFSRTCFEVTKKYLDTKHFVITYKNTIADMLETMKIVNVLFGNDPHISIIEINSLKDFLEILLSKPEFLKADQITIIYDKSKVMESDLKEKISNIDE